MESDDVEVPNFSVSVRVASSGNNSPTKALVPKREGSFTGLRKSFLVWDIPGQASMEEILQDKRKSPYSRQDFRSFLRKRQIEENLDFFINARAFSQLFSEMVEVGRIDREAIVTLKALQETGEGSPVSRVARAIVNEFIAPNSPKEINVSDRQRREVISRMSGDDDTKVKTLFDDVLAEIKHLLELNAYQKFIEIASTMNISVAESNRRLKVGCAILFVTCALLAVLIWAEFAGYVNSHWYRIIAFLPAFEGIQSIESYRRQVCYVCAYYGVTSSAVDDLDLKEAKAAGKVKVIADAFVEKNLRFLGKKLVFLALLEDAIFVGLVLAIPPYSDMNLPTLATP